MGSCIDRPQEALGSLRHPETSHNRSPTMRPLSIAYDQFQPQSCRGYTNWVSDWSEEAPGTNNRFPKTAMDDFC